MKEQKGIISVFARAYASLKEKKVFLYTAQTAYYVIFSFLPFIMLVLMSARVIYPEGITGISDYIEKNFPELYERLPSDFMISILSADVPVFSLTLIALVWSASKWARSLSDGLCVIYGVNKKRKFYTKYLFSVLWTLGFIIVAALTVAFVLYSRISPAGFFSEFRGIILCVFLTFFILAVNRFMARRKEKLKALLPGALFSAVGCTVYSSAFSIYASSYSNYSILYGSIGLILVLMLWVYNCVLIVFLGAAFNVYLKNKPLVIK